MNNPRGEVLMNSPRGRGEGLMSGPRGQVGVLRFVLGGRGDCL